MSGSGIDDEDPGNQPDGSYYQLFPISPQPGLFGGQYAEMMANARGGMTGMDAALGMSPDVSTDDTGLPPLLTLAPNLPQLADGPTSAAASQKPFNLYDATHDVLNTPWGSKGLQVAQALAQSFEDNGNKAALVGLGGAGVGALTLDPAVVLGSLGLAGLGATFNEFGKGLDAGTSFLRSVQQDNSRPLDNFGIRAVTPDFTDLVPDSD